MPIIIASTLRAGAAAAAPRRRAGGIRADGARFSLEEPNEAAPETPTGVAFVCPTALLQIQEAPEPGPAGAHAAAMRYGSDLLDHLDDLRLALLAGGIPTARLRALADALAAKREESHDPRLDGIIAEIELRAAVELAKLGRGRGEDEPGAAPYGAVSHFISKA